MATPYHIQIAPNESGLLDFAHTDEEAAEVSSLLQKDLEVRAGLPNHIRMLTQRQEPSRLLQRLGLPRPCKSTVPLVNLRPYV